MLKQTAFGFTVMLVVSAILMPAYATDSRVGIGPDGGICRAVSGNVTFAQAYSQTYTFTTTQTGALTGNGSPTTITYLGEVECVIEGGVVGDSVSVTYMISATCNQGNDTSAYNCPTDGGTVGVLSPSPNACTDSSAARPFCKINKEVAATSAPIPLDGATTILSANVTVTASPGKTGETIQLGSVNINVPEGFPAVASPSFSIIRNP